jgi:hypothetical protein
MKTRASQVLFGLFLLALLILASCGRDEPSITAPPVITPGKVVMNEIFSRGVAGNLDWIEIYNVGGSPVSLTGYTIYDLGGQGGTKPKKPIPAGTTIASHGFYVITVDTNSAGLADYFGLSSGGETVWLEDASGVVIDACTFPAMPLETTSYGRYPDGDTTWAIRSTITKGTANQQ